MTGPAWEFDEPEPVDASHLVRTKCHGCGEVCLADPGQARRARCATCLDADRAAVGSTAVGGGYTVPVGYPSPYGTSQRATEASEEFPAPVVTSREALQVMESDWPGPVLKLEAEAMRQGWVTSRGYARGRFPNLATGKPGVERESFSVRFFKLTDLAWQGYAVYVNGQWQSIMVAGRALPPFSMLGRTELSVWLAGPEKLDASWYEVIRKYREMQERGARKRAAERPKKAKSGGM